MARPGLWTPDGIVGIEKDVIPISRMELQTIARMHEIAQKFGLRIVCQKCDSGMQGDNRGSGQDPRPGIFCNCRELRYAGGD